MIKLVPGSVLARVRFPWRVWSEWNARLAWADGSDARFIAPRSWRRGVGGVWDRKPDRSPEERGIRIERGNKPRVTKIKSR